ncbi:SpoIIE family protein phosphatase [Streptomyces echinoruber]|uniref:protein-serine/threonine phosphatase n=1 Tax=Streptomyces echinoruber TaxID=68898 RepID=A0A918RAM8_9ACTN|nr:SpoIIE family protein phosphatase [Streptomyces echinoruber]GGZ91822.1 hypothetical protein GCM10010389_32920 [Streptomyces echinoruber]
MVAEAEENPGAPSPGKAPDALGGAPAGESPKSPAARIPEAVPDAPGGALAAFGTAAYLVDEQGRITAVNALAERLLGRPARDLVGRDAHDLLHRNRHGEPIPRTQCGMRQAFLNGRTAQIEEDFFARGDGSLLRVGWLITPWHAGGDGAATLVLVHRAGDAAAPAARPAAAGGGLSELERLALLAETTTQLTSTLDTDEALRRLVALVVPRLADWVVVDLLTERDEVHRSAVVHARGGDLVHREDLEGPMPPVPDDSFMPLARALRGGAATLVGPQMYRTWPASGAAEEQRRLFEETGVHSAAIVPIMGLREVLGALTLGRSQRPEAFAVADLPLLEDITRRAGLALDNARLYQRQRKVAETMQRHLLPALPRVPGLEMTARYLPAPDASQVGGDWYDAFPLPDGATALAIGDVVGHDLDAAAGMAQIRSMLRAYAWSQQAPPSHIVGQIDRAVLHITEVPMVTLVFGRMTLRDGRWELSWTNAGHPPPLLVARNGLAHYLTDGHGILLGTGADRPRSDATTRLDPGDTLLLYTDGLVETPGRSLDEGLALLRRHAASLAHRPLKSFADLLLERTRPTGNDDDVALLALRVPADG